MGAVGSISRRRATRILLLVGGPAVVIAAVVAIGALPVGITRSAAHGELMSILGKPLPPLSVRYAGDRSVDLASVLAGRASVIWLGSIEDCLACTTELFEWERFANAHPTFALVAIVAGGSVAEARGFIDANRHRLSVFHDPDRSVLAAIGVRRTPARLVVVDSVVVLASEGSEVGVIPTVGRLRALLQLAVDRCRGEARE